MEFLNDGDLVIDENPGPLDLYDDTQVLLEGSTAYALASQFSDIGGSMILVTGSTNAFAIRDPENPDASAQAGMDSSLEARFEVTTPMEYDISGFANIAGEGNASLRLDGPSGTIHAIGSAEPGMLSIGEAGMLEPGLHTFTFSSGALVVDAKGFESGTSAATDFYIGMLLYDVVSVPGVSADPTLRVAPNPVRPGQAVRIHMDADVSRIEIVDAGGRLVSRGALTPGGDGALWDASDRFGQPLAPGIYFARLHHSRGVETARLAVLPR